MKDVKIFLWVSAISTVFYEILVSSPWWSGHRHGNYDMLIHLTVPSIFLLMLAFYLMQKNYRNSSSALAVFIVILQISVLLTIQGTARGMLP